MVDREAQAAGDERRREFLEIAGRGVGWADQFADLTKIEPESPGRLLDPTFGSTPGRLSTGRRCRLDRIGNVVFAIGSQMLDHG